MARENTGMTFKLVLFSQNQKEREMSMAPIRGSSACKIRNWHILNMEHVTNVQHFDRGHPPNLIVTNVITTWNKHILIKKCDNKFDRGHSGCESALKATTPAMLYIVLWFLSYCVRLLVPFGTHGLFPFLFMAVSSICLLGRDIATQVTRARCGPAAQKRNWGN